MPATDTGALPGSLEVPVRTGRDEHNDEPKGPERTPDGRYVVIDGRRWRKSDPEAERAARDRVHAAKVALGERGDPRWEWPRD